MRATCHCQKFLALLILIHIFENEVARIHVEIWIHLHGGKVDDVATLVCGVVIPSVCVGVDYQHRLRVIALRGIVELHVPKSLDRFLAESRHELRQRDISDVIFRVSHSLFDYKFDTDTIGCMVYLNIATESEPSFDIGGQGYLIGEIKLRLQVERTAVDEIVAVMESRAIGKCMLAPVYRFISGEC